MKKVVIIGADSFIAKNFIEIAVHSGFQLTYFSRKKTGLKEEFIIEDLFNISSDMLSNNDVIINFAAIVHQPNTKDQRLYKKINTDLPFDLANKAKKAGIKQFIQMSTVAVYGNPSEININTNEAPINIYGLSKLEADYLLQKLQNNTFKISIVRPPMVYGKNSPGNLQKLLKFSYRGFPMPFKGISNMRDFINVRNLSDFLVTIIKHELFGILLPTDRRAVSTAELITIADKFSSKKLNLIKTPKFLLWLIKNIFPTIFGKLYGSLTIQCNIDTKIYCPSHNIDSGIKELLTSFK